MSCNLLLSFCVYAYIVSQTHDGNERNVRETQACRHCRTFDRAASPFIMFIFMCDVSFSVKMWKYMDLEEEKGQNYIGTPSSLRKH